MSERMRRLVETAGKSSSPFFSVVIPAFNAEYTIAATLASIVDCHEDELEIIVVDDGSTDDTARIAAGFPCRLLYNETNNGPGLTRNRGVENAVGEWIVFIDADIRIEADTFQKLREHFTRFPETTAVSGVYSEICPTNNFFSRYKNHYLNHSFDWIGRHVGFANTSLMAIRRDAFLEFGGFAPNWKAAEDTIFGAELALADYSLFMTKEIRVQHLKRLDLLRLIKDDFLRSFAMADYLWSKLRRLPFMIRHCIGHHHSLGQMLRVPGAVLILMALAFFLVTGSPEALGVATVATLFFFALMIPFLVRLAKAEGYFYALLAIPLHWLEMLVASAAIISVIVIHAVRRLM